MASLKPIIIYRYHDGTISPNPWKVVIFLYELDLPWEMRILRRDDPDVRTTEPLASITPNGRMPAMEDPNTGIKLWESGAIIEYLLDVYDRGSRLSYTSSPEKYEQHAWKHFQMSGQGPYFGQRGWFQHLHSEKLPSAIERYGDEIRRVLGVFQTHLAKTKRQWLVGDRYCFADLMFVPWNTLVLWFLLGESFEQEWKRDYPDCYAWHQRLNALESVKKALEYTQTQSQVQPGFEAQVEKPA